MPSTFTKHLLNWYRTNKRSFPWRDHPDPYAVWVSEIMAQQTRLETVIPYYQRWMQRFPTIAVLARAEQQEVLNEWEGLGYYSRARNLHKAAQVVIAEHGGKLPDTAGALRTLPGIGRYTAGAIASLSFGRDEPVVDGNVKRALARVFNVAEAVDTSAGENRIWELAGMHLPQGEAGDYNQGLMDLGARICLPRNPKCESCPVQTDCEAFALDLQTARPVKKPKPQVPHYLVAGAVIVRDDRVLIAQRPQTGLLAGMWEFPGGKLEDGETFPQALIREIQEELDAQIDVGNEIGIYRHAYTHFKVTLHAFRCTLVKKEPRPLEAQALAWVSLDQLDDYPMGKIDRMISTTLQDEKQ